MSDITPATIDKILEVATANTFELTDALGTKATYSDKKLHQVKAEPPALPDRVDVTTINGFADLVRAKLEFLADFSAYVIHIEDEDTITLKGKATDNYGRRDVLIKATPVEFRSFDFGRWVEQESFAIGLASLFENTADRAYCLELAATMTDDATRQSNDDGFTQRVNVKRGLRVKDDVEVKPIVYLAPYRTFPELEQPTSGFVFRARVTDQGPALMLVEADGGRWKIDAIAKIRAAVEAMDLGIPVIA